MSLDHQEFLRYSRQMMVVDMGEEAQEKLKAAKVVVVGMGGLGCPASLYLAAAGIGKLFLVDGDQIELSNLQRQVLYRDSDLGKDKAQVAAKRLSAINTNIECEALVEKVDRQELVALLEDCAAVLDCTDNISSRQEINRAAVALRKPVISAAALGWEGQLLELRTDIVGAACFACAYGLTDEEPLLNCSTAGVMGPVLGVLGSLQALRAIQLISGNSPTNTSKMSRFDGRTGDWMHLGLSRSAQCPVCG